MAALRSVWVGTSDAGCWVRVTRARGRYDLSVTVQAPGHEEHGDTKGAKGIATSEAALGQGITRALEWCEHNINIKECRINL